MSIEVKVPVLPESVTDATVASWHKKVGDFVARDDNMVDLETDKVVLEVPAPVDGYIKEIIKPEGETVGSDEVLAIFEEGEAPAATEEKTEAPQTPAKPATPPPAAAPAPQSTNTAGASPSARKIIAENDIDASQVKGTGRGGRITKPDAVAVANTPMEERVPMSRLRQKIAQRMVDAQSTAAMLTSFNEVDLQAVMDIRAKYKEEFIAKHGVKLGLMSFFVKAATEALKKFPIINASTEGTDIIYHKMYNIGVAVASPRGLVVPVLKNTAAMSLADVDGGIRDFAIAANEGKLAMEDLQGGTFTITNGGTFGSLMSTPILNTPQSAILGMHTIKQRPVVVDGEIVARPMMYLALTYDHRIIDGKDAVQFLVAVKEALEDPARMLLNL
ncbi:MAG TPA: dihydrolipoyllysine-residue succinyltransferase [Gammaproteobacteria bacterium]|nr:dihydrolipoyllysine-residue succinyltransferase [Xanthomonadales bacterium]MCB1595155.1 dihydrolipoyllysine-residue succinyltransferase [Xanthomonadales bacterium]HOP23289.1 dihydrolipoyllysine-residue succinyltransferase [Gammaproteobacteria bacterium]HPI96226.1 dihydrolipoyllysine-residue succinyltransferase [Gammaproteobacteria bacterium]HPQ87538.1 dihydrolipoyllysine-residue succinyltransferase [Gammaproteobacteria bacterium]